MNKGGSVYAAAAEWLCRYFFRSPYTTPHALLVLMLVLLHDSNRTPYVKETTEFISRIFDYLNYSLY
jgi:hypothetical protein